MRGLAGWGAICAQIVLAPAAMAQPMDVATDCRTAAGVAEREAGLPPGLLLAIGQIESGRRDPLTGRIDPWPWTTNLRGSGHVFGSAQDAIAWVTAQQAPGIVQSTWDASRWTCNSIRPPSPPLPQAFDPLANARYAARFLNELHARTGSWSQAVALYHSAEPSLGLAYRSQVFAAWGAGGRGIRPVRRQRAGIRRSRRRAAIRAGRRSADRGAGLGNSERPVPGGNTATRSATGVHAQPVIPGAVMLDHKLSIVTPTKVGGHV